MDGELELLRREYRQGLAARVAALEGLRPGARSADGEALAGARRLAHALRGSGATYGFPEVTSAAAALEDAPDGGAGAALDALVQVLRSIMAAADPAERTRILVIDDDAEVVRLLKARIAGPSREVVAVRTASDAERLLETADVHLIVLDLILPDRDGRELLVRLKESVRTAGIPVVVLTATPTARAECVALGAEQFVLKPFDPEVVTALVASQVQRAAAVRRESRRDPLTGLPNRAAAREAYERMSALARRERRPLAVALVDFDEFKKINDTHGHAAGDAVLRRAATVIRQALRPSDELARWGGDELVALLPNADEPGAERALAKALEALRAERFEGPRGTFGAAFSAGVALAADGTLDEALATADARLFAAKAEGRGRVSRGAEPQGAPTRQALLVEDDPAMLTVLQARLRREGLEPRAFRDGESALAAATGASFCVCLLDVQLLGAMDGFEVLRRLRCLPQWSTIPIVLLTSLGSERDIVRGFELGADDYVVKPFGASELMARLRRLLGPRSASRAVARPGGLGGVFIADQLIEVVQMLGQTQKTGTLRVSADALSGALALRDGRIVGAGTSRTPAALEAVYELLGARHGTFEFVPEREPSAADELSLPVERALLEVVRRRDEAARP